jgi:hypothetical protein
MHLYRFRILDKFDRIIAGQYRDCTDDDAARRHAKLLAALTRKSNIEIWNCDRLVSRETPGPLWAVAVDNRRLPSNDRRKKVTGSALLSASPLSEERIRGRMVYATALDAVAQMY